MRIKPFRATYPYLPYIASPESFFASIKEEYKSYHKSGFFQKSGSESIYIYRIKTSERSYTGIIACIDIRDYEEGFIKKHENTLAAKEQKQVQLILALGALVKPVLLTYQPVKVLNEWIHNFVNKNPPFQTITFSEVKNEEHTLWQVSDGDDINTIQSIFKENIPYSYIADGHHRASTMALLHSRFQKEHADKNFEKLFVSFFAGDELAIHDFNRVITTLDKCSPTKFMALLSNYFSIKVLRSGKKPQHKHEITMLLNHEWYLLKWKKKILTKYVNILHPLLDVTLFNEIVLKDILSIADIRTDQRIHYVEGIKGIEGVINEAEQHEDAVAFCLYPVEFADLMATSDKGEVMPPKSTWFEPRMLNGLLVKDLH
ncbi:MAG: DUF1015 domain-containing protein [Saprospiraceae bacterium]|nr:DUF1015 domain-containing protein [Saprospiraceae bacterium]